MSNLTLSSIMFFSFATLMAILLFIFLKRYRKYIKSEDAAWKNYQQHFGGSIEGLMSLTEMDVNKLREMKNQGGMPKWDAIRDVMHYEGVPEEIATEFIERL